jgi:hypothetical protein
LDNKVMRLNLALLQNWVKFYLDTMDDAILLIILPTFVVEKL